MGIWISLIYLIKTRRYLKLLGTWQRGIPAKVKITNEIRHMYAASFCKENVIGVKLVHIDMIISLTKI